MVVSNSTRIQCNMYRVHVSDGRTLTKKLPTNSLTIFSYTNSLNLKKNIWFILSACKTASHCHNNINDVPMLSERAMQLCQAQQ